MNSVECSPRPSSVGAGNGLVHPRSRGMQYHHTGQGARKCGEMRIAEFKVLKAAGYIDRYKNDYAYTDRTTDNGGYKTALNVAHHMLPSVPQNLIPPPPPHYPNAGQVEVRNGVRRGIWRSSGDLRCCGSEDNEGCRYFKRRDSPPDVDYNHNTGRNKSTAYCENSLVPNKFSNSYANVFYRSTKQNNHPKPKYYMSSSFLHHPQHQQQQRRKKKMRPALTEIQCRVYRLMEKFTSMSGLFRVAPDPPRPTKGSPEWDALNRSIWDVYQVKAQKETTYVRKLELWQMVYFSIQNILHRYGLYLVGSTMSGLGLESSDIDMCLLVRPCLSDARSDALSYLQAICRELEGYDFIKSPEVIMAKVPILKFRDAVNGFQVDLNCNNTVGIRNTHLLNCYARLDWRVRPLVAIVKLWAQANDINDAKRMTISSYSLALMVIHYLQCGVSPPAIPCLQGLYPRRFSAEVDLHDIDIQEEMPPFFSDNGESIGELLVGFLGYYAHFNYVQFAISVREGTLLSKEECRFTRSPKNDCAQWKLLCIEEPFDLTNTARSVYDVDTFEHIKNVFRASYEVLIKTKRLVSILPSGDGLRR